MAKITGTGEGINFESIARAMFILLGLYVLSALFYVHPGMDNVGHIREGHIQIQAGNLPEDKQASPEIL